MSQISHKLSNSFPSFIYSHLDFSNEYILIVNRFINHRVQAMTDGMLQVQLLVPSLKTDATVSATMSQTDRLTMEVKSDVKLPETNSVQAVKFIYGMSS